MPEDLVHHKLPNRTVSKLGDLLEDLVLWGLKRLSDGPRVAIGWRSDGTQMAIGWQSGGNRVALGWHSGGKRMAIRMALRWHSDGDRMAIGWHSNGTQSQSALITHLNLAGQRRRRREALV